MSQGQQFNYNNQQQQSSQQLGGIGGSQRPRHEHPPLKDRREELAKDPGCLYAVYREGPSGSNGYTSFGEVLLHLDHTWKEYSESKYCDYDGSSFGTCEGHQRETEGTWRLVGDGLLLTGKGRSSHYRFPDAVNPPDEHFDIKDAKISFLDILQGGEIRGACKIDGGKLGGKRFLEAIGALEPGCGKGLHASYHYEATRNQEGSSGEFTINLDKTWKEFDRSEFLDPTGALYDRHRSQSSGTWRISDDGTNLILNGRGHAHTEVGLVPQEEDFEVDNLEIPLDTIQKGGELRGSCKIDGGELAVQSFLTAIGVHVGERDSLHAEGR